MSERDLYDVAREVTDEVLGEGTYAEVNRGNPDPGVQRARRPREYGDEDMRPNSVVSLLLRPRQAARCERSLEPLEWAHRPHVWDKPVHGLVWCDGGKRST